MQIETDVAIIGGGPAGSTAGTLLVKYAPHLKVLILEREKFPRDHVGESQLPVISRVLNEMGAWDLVESAGFPIKVGATFRWGRNDELWDFDFLPNGNLAPEPRPAKYIGQRVSTAFQVDRSIYDKILLDHADRMGCDVKEGLGVRTVKSTGDRVDSLILDNGDEVRAKHYIDASGHAGILRRAMNVEVTAPTNLRNIAIWDYWRNADWATSIGIDGTRIQVMSGSFGWLWFIPLGPDRTSLGLVVPASYYKNSGKKPETLYKEAIEQDPLISQLVKKATSEGKLTTTKDWSFLSERLTGENWFLAGECAGFADPILSAGMSLAHAGAREIAYTILALERKDYEPEWLRTRYDESHRFQISQHIRFADYWYAHNGVFGELKEYTKELASHAGLEMSPEEAWQWFGAGGFIDHNGDTAVGGYGLGAAKAISAAFVGQELHQEIVGKSHFKANLDGAEKSWMAVLENGRITRYRSYRRDGRTVAGAQFMGWLLNFVKTERTYVELTNGAADYLTTSGVPVQNIPSYSRDFFQNLEAMVSDGWIEARTVPGEIAIPPFSLNIEPYFHANRDRS